MYTNIIKFPENNWSRKVMNKLVEIDEDKLDKIVEAINSESESSYEFYTDSEDSPTAEFVGSFFYGEADKDDIRKEIIKIFDEYVDISLSEMKQIKTWLADDNLFDNLEPYIHLTCSNIYLKEGEILSHGIGEIEVELSNELQKQLDELSEPEREYVAKNIDYYLGNTDCIYISTDERWVMIFDDEKFLDDFLES